jgi:hypothetical protein
MRSRLALFAVLALLVSTFASGPAAAKPKPTRHVFVFGAEGDNLNVYDATMGFKKQTVIRNRGDDPKGLNINAQICFFPQRFTPGNQIWFIAGEDTEQGGGRPQGWGIFRLTGNRIGTFRAKMIGRLSPTFQDTAVSNVENYGCGFTRDGRVLTTDVGDQYPGFDGNGQLTMYYPPYNDFDVDYCKLDVDIATASGMYVDPKTDEIYVASARPDAFPPEVSTGGVYRYSPPYPKSANNCGQSIDGTGQPVADVDKELFIAPVPFSLNASGVARSKAGTFYVTSVFTGRIDEYDAEGDHLRTILEPPPGELPPYSTGTPYGIGADSRGTIYFADLGIGLGPPPGPEDDAGSEFAITFDADGNPSDPIMFDDGLDFPDGIGVLELVGSRQVYP